MDSTLVTFLELLPDSAFLIDKKAQIKFVNSSALDTFQYDKSELIDKRIEILIPTDLRNQHVAKRDGYAKEPRKMNMSNRSSLQAQKKDGSCFPIDVSLAPIKGENEGYTLAITKDLSEKKYVKNLVKRNKELEQFTYIASHDLQEPLRTIISLINVLSKKDQSNFDQQTIRSIAYMSQSVTRMSELVKALLDYNRLGKEQEIEVLDCTTIIQEVLSDLNIIITNKEVKVNLGELPKIKAHKTEMRLLFQNLISNGIKFNKPGVFPEISISQINEDEIYHTIAFKDNGIGIAEENQKKIFNVFTRLHSKAEYEGTGIGLAHCKKIIENHQGEISLNSELGEGSTFIIKLNKTI